jgi:hypothetical protein
MSYLSIHEPEALQLVHALLKQGISVQLRVSGNSMQPLLRGDEILEIAPLAGQMPRLGDLLLFRTQDNKALVHRVIWRHWRQGRVQTQGDACLACDAPIPVAFIFGRVERIIFPYCIINLQKPSMRFKGLVVVSRLLVQRLVQRLKRGSKNLFFLKRSLE